MLLITVPINITGHPALIGRHRPFPVTHEAAKRWLHHMQQALDNTSDIDHDSNIMLMNFFRFIIITLIRKLIDREMINIVHDNIFFFRHTAYFLVAGIEQKNPSLHPCKDAPGRHPCKNF